MSFFNVIWQERHYLLGSAHAAIVSGMHEAWRRCRQRGNNPQEPDFVASLVLESTPRIYIAWNHIFSKQSVSFSISAVYCHQTPRVKYANMAGQYCELGDLLFVHIHRKLSGDFQRNALLYQVKISSKQPYIVPSSEEDQLRLYTDWPDFQYYHSGSLSGKTRRVNPKVPHSGAQYLLIDDRSPDDPRSGLSGILGTYPIGSCMPDKYLYDHNDLSRELFKFLLFLSGRPFEERDPSLQREDWSDLVWDLLETGIRKAFNRKRSGRTSDPRYAGGPVHLIDGYSFNRASSRSATAAVSRILGARRAFSLFSEGDLPPSNEGFDQGDDEPGVSVILIETGEGEAE